MATKILLLEAPGFMQNFVSFPEASVTPAAGCREEWAKLSATDSLLTLAPASARFDPSLGDAFDKSNGSLSCAFFQRAEDMQSSDLGFLNEPVRAFGAKAHLAKGSTIYSETLFNAGGAGAKLDPLYRFAKTKLPAQVSLDVWASFQALLYVAIRALPHQGENATGERVEVQVGADDKNFVYTIRFDLPATDLPLFRRQPVIELARACAGILELRFVRDAGKAEISAHFPLAARPAGCIEVHTVHVTSAIESLDSARDYQFQTFANLPATNDAAEPRVLKAGGFRKKFSEKLSAEPAPEAAATPAPAAAPAPKVMVSGAASLGKKDAPAATPTTPPAAPSPEHEKQIAALREQVETLKADLARKDGVIKELHANKTSEAAASAGPKVNKETENNQMIGLELELKEKISVIEKLSRELEEIKDPTKRGVISGIVDNTVEAWKQKFERAQKELEDAQGREKEMLAVLDKAVVMKDEANKKMKDLETKLRTASGGKSSQVTQLEKQVEEQKRQNKELSKRVSSLTDQLTAAGIRAA